MVKPPHDEAPFFRSAEEVEKYLKETFPKYVDVVRVGQTEPFKITGNKLLAETLHQRDVFVGVGGAFGCGPSWDAAVAHLMTDEMVGNYV